MSFHQDEFHETKSERKYYEDKKQIVLSYIRETMSDITMEKTISKRNMMFKLREIKNLVNDI